MMKLLLSLTALAFVANAGMNCPPSILDWSCCSSSSPCCDGGGDCDSDSDCGSGQCSHDVGAQYGVDSLMDVCVNTGCANGPPGCDPANNDWSCCSPTAPCVAGDGDCDTDADCATGYCAHNVGSNYGGGSNFDVCEFSNACNPGNEDWGCCTGQCLAGEGDCDSDSDCATNKCAHDVGAQYGAVASFDVCEASCAPSVMDWSCCTSSARCNNGDGDCDSDADCLSGYCAHDVGAFYGVSGSFDVCEQAATCAPSNMDWSCCTPSNPCNVGDGDCDSDSDCVSGAMCSHDVGSNYGAASSFDVCETAVKNCSPANEDWNCCSATDPCDDEEGDCDADSECMVDMVCTHNVGTEYGISSSFDVCRKDPCRVHDDPKGRPGCRADPNCVSMKLTQGQFNGGATCNYKKCFFCFTKSCSLINKSKKCNKDPACGWNPSSNACEDGYVLQCSDIDKRKLCSQKTGCVWTGAKCSAGVIGCSDRTGKKKCVNTTFVSNNVNVACKWKNKLCMEDNDHICSAQTSANQCNKVTQAGLVSCKFNNGVCQDA